jgi:hypothetical protein
MLSVNFEMIKHTVTIVTGILTLCLIIGFILGGSKMENWEIIIACITVLGIGRFLWRYTKEEIRRKN